jgi:DNA repair protein RecO (recombination protein O)
MPLSSKAIVISSLKYGDSSLIVRLFTLEGGLQAYLIKGILGRKKGPFRAGHFQPLTQLEIVGNPSRSGKLGYLREAAIAFPYQTVHADIRKSTLALFLSEILAQGIREEEPDPALYSYLESALQWLDHHEQIANFHIRFLIGLSRYLGFYPDPGPSGAPFFDLGEGAFVQEPSLHPVLGGEVLELFTRFLETGFDSMAQVRLTQGQRRELLRALITYYEIHLPGFREPRSLAVLDAVFA